MIKVNSVWKGYGRFNALSNVTVEVESGKTIGVVGPSGSGKTTLMRLIAGLEKPDEGTVYIDGALASTPDYLLEPSKRNISAIFQTPALWPHMTVQENIDFVHSGKERNSNGVLESVGLTVLRDKYPNELSGGEARRVSIIRGLIADKKFLLMDEPLVNLNPELKNLLHEVIMEWTVGRRMGVLYITHDRSELDYADKVYVMNNSVLEPEP
jgi:iron(III) transport system ATP-binding protein